MCVCSSVLAGSGGPASRARSGVPHLFLWLLGCPFLAPFFFLLFFPARPRRLLRSSVSGPGPWALAPCFPFLPPCRPVLFFFLFSFFLPSAPTLSLAFFGFRPRVPCASALCVVCSVGLSLLGSPCALASFVSPARPLAAPWWLPPPPPLPSPFVSRGFRRRRSLPFFFLLFSSFSFLRPRCLRLSLVSGPACRRPWRCVLFVLLASCFPALRALSPRLCFPLGCWLLPGGWCPPPPFRVSRFSSLPLGAPVVFFPLVVRPRCLWLSSVSGPGCPGPRRCVLFALIASRFSALRALSPLLCFPPGRWLLPGGCCPPPPFLSRGFRRRRSVLCALCCAVLCVPGCGAAPRCGALCRPVLCCCVLCCFVALVLVPLRVVPCPVVLPFAQGPCALRRFVLCAVCVLSLRVGACCCSPLCVVLCVFWGVCVPCPPRSVQSCAWLCWCACVVLFVWCVLLLAPGAVVRCWVLRCFLWCSVVRCWVWWPVAVCWWCVSVSVSLFGCAVCFPVVGAVCRGALPPCVVFCGAVLSRGAVLLCSAVVWRCCWYLIALPSCGLSCCTVLRYWLSVLFFARWWCLRAMVPFPSLPARTKNTDYYPVLPRARLCVGPARSRRIWSRRSSLDC